MRFKIDIYSNSVYFYGLYVRRVHWFSEEWVLLQSFQTRDAAKEYYEKIKDLPEYLQ